MSIETLRRPHPAWTTLCLLVCAVATSGTASPALPRTTGPRTYVFGRAAFVTGNSPLALARRDLDGDGFQDLVVVASADNAVSVLRGASGGAFLPHTSYAVGTAPVDLAVADLDLDGKLDLAVVDQNCPGGTCGGGSVAVLLGNGDGTFQPAVPYATNTNPQSVLVGDANGDGLPDLAVVNAISTISQVPGTVSILLGNGNGTFQPATEFPAGSGPGAIAGGDFDGDGRLDLAITNYVGLAVVSAVAVLRGNGNGTFQAPVAYATGNGPVRVVAADLDADGVLDLATADLGANAVSVLRGNGNATFQSHVDFPAGFGPKSIALTDLDHDGRLDLALTTFTGTNGGGSVVTLRGNGNGTFQPYREALTGQNGPAIVAGDIDGDSRVDLAVPDLTRHVTVLLGKGDGTLYAATRYAAGPLPVSDAAGDLNADRNTDLVVANGTGSSFSVLLGNGDGTFQPGVQHAAGLEPSAVLLRRFNRDRKLDLAITNAGANTVSILLGNGNGTFQPAHTYATGLDPESLTDGDFNANGRNDLAVADRSGNSASILLGNGDGTFQPRMDFAAGPGPISITRADFDHDGTLDLAVADVDTSSFGPGRVSILLGHGNGTFGSPAPLDAGIRATAIASGDFDADGKADLAVGTNLDVFGSVVILRGNGDGTFQPPVSYPTGRVLVFVSVGDFNGDVWQDLAAVNQGNNTVTLLKGRGDGSFELQAQYDAGSGPSAVVMGDFDQDRALDMAVTNLTNTLSVFVSRR